MDFRGQDCRILMRVKLTEELTETQETLQQEHKNVRKKHCIEILIQTEGNINGEIQ